MNRVDNLLIGVLTCAFSMGPLPGGIAQDPVPDDTIAPVVVDDDFNVRRLIKEVRQYAKDQGIGFGKRMLIGSLVRVKSKECMIILKAGMDIDPEIAQGLIDWENFDVEKFTAALAAILEFILAIVDRLE